MADESVSGLIPVDEDQLPALLMAQARALNRLGLYLEAIKAHETTEAAGLLLVKAAQDLAHELSKDWPPFSRIAGDRTYYSVGDRLMMVVDWGEYELTSAIDIRLPPDVASRFLMDVEQILETAYSERG